MKIPSTVSDPVSSLLSLTPAAPERFQILDFPTIYTPLLGFWRLVDAIWLFPYHKGYAHGGTS